MPGIAKNLIRLVFAGHVAPGQTWSTSLWVVNDAGPDVSEPLLDVYVASLVTPVNVAIAAVANDCWSANTNMATLTGYGYSPGSRTADVVSSPHGAGASGTGSTVLPPFCSIVASLRTPDPSKSGRGRNYLPMTAANLDSNADLPLTKVTDLATKWATMIRAINANTATTAVAGTVIVASFTKGTYAPVTRVLVDSKVDTQHRRSDKVVAAFAFTSAV